MTRIDQYRRWYEYERDSHGTVVVSLRDARAAHGTDPGWQRAVDLLAHRDFEYVSLDGPRFRSRVDDILTQLFGHSWYHRGQIALLVRSIGAEPAVTDFVFWTREPLD